MAGKDRITTKKYALPVFLVWLLVCLSLFRINAKAEVNGEEVVAYARQYVGKLPYVWGGGSRSKDISTWTGADCSGFICGIYKHFGIDLWANRTSIRKSSKVTNIGTTDYNQAKPGDILCWSETEKGKSNGHVALYAGNGWMVHETTGSYGDLKSNVLYTPVTKVSKNRPINNIVRPNGVVSGTSSSSQPSSSQTGTPVSQRIFVEVPANFGVVQCYSSLTSTAKYRKFASSSSSYTLYCTKYADRSDGIRRFFCKDASGNELWFNNNSSFTVTYCANSITANGGSSMTLPYNYGQRAFGVSVMPSNTNEVLEIKTDDSSLLSVGKTGKTSFYVRPAGSRIGTAQVTVYGEKGNAEGRFNVTVTDPAAPVISDVYTADAGSASVNICFTASDEIELSNIGIRIWAGSETQSSVSTVWDNGFTSLGGGKYRYTLKYADHHNAAGVYQIRVYAKDSSGNETGRDFSYTRICPHSWTSAVTKAADCTQTGVRTYTCIYCQASRTETIPATGHSYGGWTVAEAATYDKEGREIRVCAHNASHIETRSIAKLVRPQNPAGAQTSPAPVSGSDPSGNQKSGTVSEGDPSEQTSVAGFDQVLTGMKGDGDAKNSSFIMLRARASKTTKRSVTISWRKVKNADGYLVYGAMRGKRFARLAAVSAGKKTYTHTKLKKGTYYKYIVAAYQIRGGVQRVIGTSRNVVACTKGGSYDNYKSVSVSQRHVRLARNQSVTVKAKAVAPSKNRKVRQYRKVKFETTNKKVAAVSKNGTIRGVGKGTCTVYAYAQNGVYKRIRVTVTS